MKLKNIAIITASVILLVFIITIWKGCSDVGKLKERIAKFEGEKGAFDERQKLRDEKITALEGKNKVLDELYKQNKEQLDGSLQELAVANGKVSTANSRAAYYKHLLETGGTITQTEFKDVVDELNKQLGSEVIVYQGDKIILTGSQAGYVLSIMNKAGELEVQFKAAQGVIVNLTQRVALCDGKVANLEGMVVDLKDKVTDLGNRLTIAEVLIRDTKKMLEHPPLSLTLKKDVPIAIVTAIIGGTVYYFLNKNKNK